MSPAIGGLSRANAWLRQLGHLPFGGGRSMVWYMGASNLDGPLPKNHPSKAPPPAPHWATNRPIENEVDPGLLDNRPLQEAVGGRTQGSWRSSEKGANLPLNVACWDHMEQEIGSSVFRGPEVNQLKQGFHCE